MEKCDTVTYNLSLGAQFRFAFDSLGVLGSIFLLIIMRKTPTLRGFSGMLLFKEQITCLLEQLLRIALNVIIQYSLSTANTLILASIQTVKNVSFLLLLAINCTLYTAICRGTAFRRIWNWKRIIGTMVACWVASILYGMWPLFNDDYFVFDCDAMFPFPSRNAYWRPIIYIVFYCLALFASIVLLYKIVHRQASFQSLLNLQAISDTHKTVNLAISVFVVCIFHTVSNIVIYGLWYSELSLSDTSVRIGVFFNVVVFVNYSFLNLRLFFFLTLYKPMLVTVKKLFRCQSQRKIDATEIAHIAFQQTASDPEENKSLEADDPFPNLAAGNSIGLEVRDPCAPFGKVVPISSYSSQTDPQFGVGEVAPLQKQTSPAADRRQGKKTGQNTLHKCSLGD